MRFRFVSFLSDYGLSDEFVGVCHGVIKRIAPEVQIIDLAHGIPAQDVAAGAATLARSVGYLPPAVHLAIVDPGVGTGRRCVGIESASGSLLVGPDNGLLLPAAEALGGVARAHEIERRELMLERVSATFHGRDVFAPAAAHLASGVALRDVGPPIAVEDLVRLSVPVVHVGASHVHATVVVVDRFGNVQLNARPDDLRRIGLAEGDSLEVRVVGGEYRARYARTFGDVDPGALLVLEDSSGQITVAMNRGRADELLAARPGDTITIARI